jgi:signal transduction histidine kinase
LKIGLTLRQKSEAILKRRPSKTAFQLSEANALKLVHELEVYQLELEMVNEELILSKEEAAKIATEKYAELYEFAPLGYLTLSREGIIVERNIAAGRLLGNGALELKNRSFASFVSIESIPVLDHFLREIFAGSAKESCEVTLNTESNFRVHVRLTGIARCNKGHCLICIVDNSENKRVEEALRWNQSLLLIMSNSSPFGFLVVDNRTDDILYFNDRFLQIWNIECLADQMRNGKLKNNDIIPYCLPILADIASFAESCKPLQNESNRITIEDEIAFKEGRTIQRYSMQIRGADDQYYGRFYLFEDITESKQRQILLGTTTILKESAEEMIRINIALKKSEIELKNSVLQLRKLTQYTEKVREDERVAISRELHDDLGQALTAVTIDLATIAHHVSDIKVISKIEKVSDLVIEIIKTVQRITSQLRPRIIDDFGLEIAIEWYTKEFAQRTGVKFILDLNSGKSITPDASLVIFRIMQESLTNIARHSGATKVRIKLLKDVEYFIFMVSDNGIGITESEINSRKSFGILSMKERAASLGGTFKIYRNSKPETVVELIFPLNFIEPDENSDL